MGRAAEARQDAESLVALASEHGLTFWRIYGAVVQGWSLVIQGEEDLGSLIRQNLARLRATGAEMPRA